MNTPSTRPLRGLGQTNTQWFADEVLPHEPALREWLRQRFPWLNDVDNIARDSIARLWRRLGSQERKPPHSPKAMLFAIARNAAYDEGRRRGIARMQALSEEASSSLADERANVAEVVSVRQELELLSDAVRALPDGCRQVITLCKLYSMAPRQVAAKLGISEHTVRAQIARGMRRCAAYLRHRGVTPNRP